MALHNPYVGPRPFTEQEERFFFGRSEEIEILTSLVVARRASLLFAQSGAGKTSLLLAGLTPRLLRHQRLVRNRPVVQPLVSAIRLARVGKGIEEQQPSNIFVQSAGSSLAPDENTTIPRDATLLGLLSSWIPAAPSSAADTDDAMLPFLLVFDQFEELFTRHLSFRHQREAFFKQVAEALSARDDLRVLFSMREDYLGELTPYAHLLPDQLRQRFRLERLRFDAALEAVKRPAERAAIPHPFAEGVAEELCRNLQSGGTDDIEAILLQVACKRLWHNLPDDRAEIGRDDLKAAGNVDSALEAYYNDVVTTVVEELAARGEPVGERRVRHFFSQQLLTPSRTRALVYRDDKSGLTAGLPNAAIDVLSRSDINILRREIRGAATWYELSHDRMIQPVLTANERWEETNLTTLQKRAVDWSARGRRDQDLLNRLDLRDVEEQVSRTPGELLTTVEEEFLVKSRQRLATASARLRVNIDELGWGVLFAEDDPNRDAIRLALAPLLAHRRKLTESRFEQFEFAVKAGETAQQFLARYGALARSSSDTGRMPYYLLIVAGPERIPFEFQYALDVHYAVGRLDFQGRTREETLLMYARYARSVVDAESGAWGLPRQAVIFSALNKFDTASQMLATALIHPMLEELRRDDLTVDDWQVAPVVEELATRSSLLRLLGGDRTPALLFSAAHGLGFAPDDALQRAEQGALVCSDWQSGQPMTPAVYVAARDVVDEANPLGMIVFLVGEYGAGTPEYSNRPGDKRERLARQPFVSALAQRLLSHPKGTALAVIGHVDVSWMLTFEQFTEAGPSGERRWKSEGNMTFVNTVSRLVRGHTVGSAMEFFNTRYTQAAADLVDALLNPSGVSERRRELLMLEAVDVRNYIVLGDPAVRVPVDGLVPERRPVIQVDPKIVEDIDAALQVKAPPPFADVHSPVFSGSELLAKAVPPPPAAPAPGMPAGSGDVAAVPASLAVFNGINAQTGQYFYPPQAIEEFARLASGQTTDSSQNLDEAYKAAGSSYFESNASTES